jgi:hypothetical protein
MIQSRLQSFSQLQSVLRGSVRGRPGRADFARDAARIQNAQRRTCLQAGPQHAPRHAHRAEKVQSEQVAIDTRGCARSETALALPRVVAQNINVAWISLRRASSFLSALDSLCIISLAIALDKQESVIEKQRVMIVESVSRHEKITGRRPKCISAQICGEGTSYETPARCVVILPARA